MPVETHISETELLAELVGKKVELLTQLFDLGRLQIDFIAGDDLTQLLKVLSAKQRVLAALQNIERGLDPFRDQDPDARDWSSAAARQQCAELARQAERLLAEIVRQEKQSEMELKLRRDEAAARLNVTHAAAQARGAYAGQYGRVSGQLDLTSES